MEYINVITPIHQFNDDVKNYLANAINSYEEAKKFLNEKTNELDTRLTLVCNSEILDEITSFVNDIDYKDKCTILSNGTGKIDFCSQINFATEFIKDKFFSILEYDDEYYKKWFYQFTQYQLGNEDVSIFLPVNVVYDSKSPDYWQYGNEMPLATSFSNELGYIDFDCLQNFSAFNITGGIIRTEDFISCGKFKSSIKVSFTYELFLRMTKKNYKIMVIPKQGYKHAYNVEGSLTKQYEKEISENDIEKWFDLAKKECAYKDDRGKNISKTKKPTFVK